MYKESNGLGAAPHRGGRRHSNRLQVMSDSMVDYQWVKMLTVLSALVVAPWVMAANTVNIAADVLTDRLTNQLDNSSDGSGRISPSKKNISENKPAVKMVPDTSSGNNNITFVNVSSAPPAAMNRMGREWYFFKFDGSYILPYYLEMTTNVTGGTVTKLFSPGISGFGGFFLGYNRSWFEWDLGAGYYPQFADYITTPSDKKTDPSQGTITLHHVPIIARFNFLIPLGAPGLTLGVGTGIGGNYYVGSGWGNETLAICPGSATIVGNPFMNNCTSTQKRYNYNFNGIGWVVWPRISIGYRTGQFGFDIHTDYLVNLNAVKFTGSQDGFPDITGQLKDKGFGVGILGVGLSLAGYF